MPADEHEVTLASYDGGVDAYLAGSADEACLPLLTRLTEAQPSPARVLEIGSGPGYDATRLRADGYAVQVTDASDGFLDHLRADGWTGALRYDLDRDDPPEGDWDAVYANAVLHHLRRDRLGPALVRLRRGLRPGTLLVAATKTGREDGWSTAKLPTPRWFTYWAEPDLWSLLDSTGWHVDQLCVRTGRHDEWLDVVARA